MANQCGVDEGLRELALFAGAGGGIIGGKLLGWKTICAVERDAHAAQVLAQRQNDGCLEPFPIWSDVCSFDGKPWRGLVDVVSGGFPCQDISAAGKGAGIDGERSGMWSQMARIIGEVLPRFVYVENSPMLVGRGLTRVISNLASLGYDAKWCIVSASDVGAPHQRDRIWIRAERRDILSHSKHSRTRRREQLAPGVEKEKGNFPDTSGERFKGNGQPIRFAPAQSEHDLCSAWWEQDPSKKTESPVDRMVDGLANWSEQLRAIGNGQVPLAHATAWRILSD